ncbi:response regulator, partial [Janthinobacterium sp.]|uniref:response regulator n=1 Tax=Janthinobacterium sp. TaxID=1871054 RepID=UPI00293D7AF6
GPAPLTDLRLLVVEDNAANQQVARELLSHEGAAVVVANGGRAAIDAVRAAGRPFDCVLMDIQMPDMDGYTATRLLRAEPGMAGLPIIAMTANVMPSDRAAALEAGMDDHVGKPFDLPQLVALILLHSGRRARAGAGGLAARAPAPRLAVSGWNVAAALARFGGNLPVYREALRNFASGAPALLDAVPAAASAPPPGAGAALHSLKGIAATVGADDLAGLAGIMERAVLSGAWPGDWQGQRAHLALAGRRAARDALQLDALLAQTPAPLVAAAAAPQATLPEALTALRALLEAADLDALPLFAEFKRSHGGVMPVECAGLEHAIEQFNFLDAAQQCGVILHRLESACPC